MVAGPGQHPSHVTTRGVHMGHTVTGAVSPVWRGSTMKITATFTTDRATDRDSAEAFLNGLRYDASAVGVRDITVVDVATPVTFENQDALDAYGAERIAAAQASVVSAV